MNKVCKLFGITFSNDVSLFVRKNVLTNEKYFLYCNRNEVRHNGEYSNAPIEGTNFSIKHSSVSTNPCLYENDVTTVAVPVE